MLMIHLNYTLFESIAKTNTTHTMEEVKKIEVKFESIAKTNTTHTVFVFLEVYISLRVLLKQIQHTLLYRNMNRSSV